MQCECDCHKTAFIVCTDCCSLRNIREKNKLMSYPNPEYRLFQRVEKLENEFQNQINIFNDYCKFKVEESVDFKNHIGSHIIKLRELESGLENYREYRTAIEDLGTDVMYLKERVEKLESMYQSDFDKTKEVIFSLSLHKESISELIKWRETAIEKNIQDVERIRKLESDHLGQQLDPKVWVFVNERLDKLEAKTVLMPDVEETLKQSKWTHEQIDRLDKLFNGLETEINIVRALGSRAYHPRKPYECPVCKGEGKNKNRLVMDGFEDQSAICMKNPECHACEGKGIVWG